MLTPDFNFALRFLKLPPWAKFALARKWEAGEREHAGGDGDLTIAGFSPVRAQAAEALDIINYYLALIAEIIPRDPHMTEAAWGIMLDKLEQNARDAAIILKRCGEKAAHAAATEALNRASV